MLARSSELRQGWWGGAEKVVKNDQRRQVQDPDLLLTAKFEDQIAEADQKNDTKKPMSGLRKWTNLRKN
jgi:hypothetical protein